MSIGFKFALTIVVVLAAPAVLTAASDEAQARGGGLYGSYKSYSGRQISVRPIRPMVIGTTCRHGHRVAISHAMTGRPDRTSRPGSAYTPPHPRSRPCLA